MAFLFARCAADLAEQSDALRIQDAMSEKRVQYLTRMAEREVKDVEILRHVYQSLLPSVEEKPIEQNHTPLVNSLLNLLQSYEHPGETSRFLARLTHRHMDLARNPENLMEPNVFEEVVREKIVFAAMASLRARFFEVLFQTVRGHRSFEEASREDVKFALNIAFLDVGKDFLGVPFEQICDGWNQSSNRQRVSILLREVYFSNASEDVYQAERGMVAFGFREFLEKHQLPPFLLMDLEIRLLIARTVDEMSEETPQFIIGWEEDNFQ